MALRRYKRIGLTGQWKPRAFNDIDVNHPHSEGLIAWFPFFEGSGAPFDVFGPLTKVENLNGPVWGTSSVVINPRIEYDGINDVTRIIDSDTVGHPLDFTSGPFSIVCWFSFSASGTLVSKRDNNDDQWQVYLSNGRFSFRAGGEWINGNTTLSTATLYMGVVTVDSSGNPLLFIDGESESFTNGSGSPPFVFTHRDVSVSFGARWTLEPVTAFDLDGNLFNIMFYDYKLPQDLIRSLFFNPFENVNRTERTWFIPAAVPTGVIPTNPLQGPLASPPLGGPI